MDIDGESEGTSWRSLVQASRNYLPASTKTLLRPDFYLAFWNLQYYDIHVPEERWAIATPCENFMVHSNCCNFATEWPLDIASLSKMTHFDCRQVAIDCSTLQARTTMPVITHNVSICSLLPVLVGEQYRFDLLQKPLLCCNPGASKCD